jgi:hypothetical protein
LRFLHIYGREWDENSLFFPRLVLQRDFNMV